jgi:deoxyadenosine/deoxycytidine kinase
VQRFVVVEGLIGAGKTTLCRLLARAWKAGLVLEPSEDNPFLGPFYADPARFAFPVQMFYLVNRWRQQDQIRQQDLFEDLVVSDYLFAKDRMFAEKTLEPAELDLYDRFARALGESSPRPDLVVWLDAPTSVLLERIRRRAAPGEAAITRAYLDDLRARYHRLWATWSACPVLALDNQDMDYADDPAGRSTVLELIQDALSGKTPPKIPGSTTLVPAEATREDREIQPSLFGAGAWR